MSELSTGVCSVITARSDTIDFDRNFKEFRPVAIKLIPRSSRNPDDFLERKFRHIAGFYFVGFASHKERERERDKHTPASTGNRIIDRLGPMNRPIRRIGDVMEANLKLVTHFHPNVQLGVNWFEARSTGVNTRFSFISRTPYGLEMREMLRENIKSFSTIHLTSHARYLIDRESIDARAKQIAQRIERVRAITLDIVTRLRARTCSSLLSCSNVVYVIDSRDYFETLETEWRVDLK